MKLKHFTKGFIFVYLCFFLIFLSLSPVYPAGECDDYALAAISIMNDGTWGISDADVTSYYESIPEFGEHALELSGRFTRSGEELTYYFPTYSIVCLPLLYLFQALELSLAHAFPLTNVLAYTAMLWMVYRYLKIEDGKKLLLVLLLACGTVRFYYGWTSAEVLIAALLGCALVFWYNRQWRRAALFLSMASTMNPTLLAAGLVMIAEFLWERYTELRESGFRRENFRTELIHTIKFCCCFLVGLLPFAYNYYHTGYINLTASHAAFLNSEDSVFARLHAYLFDLNFGIFPYYPLILLLAFIMVVVALMRRKPRFIVHFFAFLITVFSYSIMSHVNHGMDGIARYSVWSVEILLFSVVVFWGDCFRTDSAEGRYAYVGKTFTYVLLGISILYSSQAVSVCKPLSYVDMMPLASHVLDTHPALYNPLPSTFHSRIAHEDGGYDYETPIVYLDKTRSARKILASRENVEELSRSFVGSQQDMEWFFKQLRNLGEEESYISIPRSRTLLQGSYYDPSQPMIFTQDGYNVGEYTLDGFASPESSHTWTDKTEAEFIFHLHEDFRGKTMQAQMELLDVYDRPQKVSIAVNGDCVLDTTVTDGQDILFTFTVPKTGIVDMTFSFPDALSPASLGIYEDPRLLALAIESMTLQETGTTP